MVAAALMVAVHVAMAKAAATVAATKEAVQSGEETVEVMWSAVAELAGTRSACPLRSRSGRSAARRRSCWWLRNERARRHSGRGSTCGQPAFEHWTKGMVRNTGETRWWAVQMAAGFPRRQMGSRSLRSTARQLTAMPPGWVLGLPLVSAHCQLWPSPLSH